MPRDRSRQGALAAALVVGLYLPLQPLLALAARLLEVRGAADLDGLARWTSTAVVLLLGAALASALAADYRRRRGEGPMQRWTTGFVAGLAVLTLLSALLTLAQAFLSWADSAGAAIALLGDVLMLLMLAAIAALSVEPHGPVSRLLMASPSAPRARGR